MTKSIENPSFSISRQTSTLKKIMNDYESNGTVSFPKVRAEIGNIVEAFKPVSADLVKSVSEKAKSICK